MAVNEKALEDPIIAITSSDLPIETVRFQHFPALDGVRAIAIISVMLYHLEFLVPELNPLVRGGFLGVDIFFVLSGFLITSILLKEQDSFGSISLKNFFIRRFFRLAPAFWFFLVVLYFFGNYILPPIQAQIIYDNYNFAYAFFYLMNWHRASNEAITGNLNHTWSLAIEEQFYIIWSVVLYKAFSEGRNRKQITIATAGFIVVIILWRAIRAFIGVDVYILYYSTDTRIDALLIGCVASMIYCWRLVPDAFFESRPFRILTITALLISFLILFGNSYTDIDLYYGSISLFTTSIATLLLWIVTRNGTWLHFILESGPLRWIGRISYPLYLWHYAFYEFAKKSFESVAVQVIVGIATAIVVAAISYYIIEKPFLRIKDRFSKNTSVGESVPFPSTKILVTNNVIK